jgi:hypothetical protein
MPRTIAMVSKIGTISTPMELGILTGFFAIS